MSVELKISAAAFSIGLLFTFNIMGFLSHLVVQPRNLGPRVRSNLGLECLFCAGQKQRGVPSYRLSRNYHTARHPALPP
jgi:hypothetical protein